jgi:hypothetical protein
MRALLYHTGSETFCRTYLLHVGIYDFGLQGFLSVEHVSQSRKPVPVAETTCRLMRDTRFCRGKPKEVADNNVFSLEGYPFVENSLSP